MDKIYKIWTKFDKYTGNFKRQFVAFMMGYENSYDEGFYQEYTSNFEKNANNLKNLQVCLKFTNQEVDDWSEETCYNINPFPTNEGKYNCNGIFIQFSRKPTKEEFDAFKLRAKKFPAFFNSIENYKIDMNVEDFCVDAQQTTTERVF